MTRRIVPAAATLQGAAHNRLVGEVYGESGPAVLLSHAPPKGYQDEIPGGVHVGSAAVAHFAPRFAAVVSVGRRNTMVA